MFRFKKFTVAHSHAAMKVGFDGILLGAWASMEDCDRVLDVGAGTGLVALMLAQRTEQQKVTTLVDAVEVDSNAIRDASQNFATSPWSCRLNLIHARFQDWVGSTPLTYDLIVSNPPYFSVSDSSQLSEDQASRKIARQQVGLGYRDLVVGASRLMRDSGRLCVIIPATQYDHVVGLAQAVGLSPHRKLEVRPTPSKSPHRVVIDFRRGTTKVEVEQLTIELSRHVYSNEFKDLARDFYLAF